MEKRYRNIYSIYQCLLYAYISSNQYLARHCNCSDLPTRYIITPTKWHWLGLRDIFLISQGIKQLSIFYKRNWDLTLTGYILVSYTKETEILVFIWSLKYHTTDNLYTYIVWKRSQNWPFPSTILINNHIDYMKSPRNGIGFTEWWPYTLVIWYLFYWITNLVLFRCEQVILGVILLCIFAQDCFLPAMGR